jgi:hypothetical protein
VVVAAAVVLNLLLHRLNLLLHRLLGCQAEYASGCCRVGADALEQGSSRRIFNSATCGRMSASGDVVGGEMLRSSRQPLDIDVSKLGPLTAADPLEQASQNMNMNMV